MKGFLRCNYMWILGMIAILIIETVLQQYKTTIGVGFSYLIGVVIGIKNLQKVAGLRGEENESNFCKRN